MVTRIMLNTDVRLASFSVDGLRLAVVGNDGRVRVFAIPSGEPVAHMALDEAPDLAIDTMALSHSGALLAAGRSDGTAQVLAVQGGEVVATLRGCEGTSTGADRRGQPTRLAPGMRVQAIAFAADDRLVAIGFSGRRVGVWRVGDWEHLATFRDNPPPGAGPIASGPSSTMVTSVAISADAAFVFAGFGDMSAAVWALPGGAQVFSAREHLDAALHIQPTAEGLGVVTRSGTLFTLTPQGKLVRRIESGEHWDEACLVGCGEPRVLSRRTGDAEISLWQRDDMKQVQGTMRAAPPCRPGFRFLAASQDGMRWVVADRRERLRICPAGVEVRAGSRLEWIEVLPDGEHLATVGEEPTVDLWDMEDGAAVGSLPCPGGVGSLASHPSTNLFAVGSLYDEQAPSGACVYLWHISPLQLLGQIHGHEDQILSLSFSPSGHRLASASLDGTVRLWRVTPAAGPHGRAVVAELARLEVEALDPSHVHLVDEDRVLVFSQRSIAMWHGLTRQLWQAPAPVDVARQWWVSATQDLVACAARMPRLTTWSLTTGQLVSTCHAEGPRPVPLNPQGGRAFFWQAPGGPYLHTPGGPRGWSEPLCVSWVHGEAMTVVAAHGTAQVVRIGSTAGAGPGVPFGDLLKASRVLEDTFLLVDDKGEVSIYPLQSLTQALPESVV